MVILTYYAGVGLLSFFILLGLSIITKYADELPLDELLKTLLILGFGFGYWPATWLGNRCAAAMGVSLEEFVIQRGVYYIGIPLGVIVAVMLGMLGYAIYVSVRREEGNN